MITIDDRFIPVPGGQLFARCWQPANQKAAAIILLHDSLGSVEQWRTLPETIARMTQRKVIAYDRLGFGYSSQRFDTLSQTFICDEANIYLPLITEAFECNQHVLFGHSVGGGMALTAATTLTGKHSCLAVISESAQTFIETRTLAGIAKEKTAFEQQWYFAKLERWHQQRAKWVLDAWTDTWLSPEFRQWSLSQTLPQIQCPVLAIHGDQDPFGSPAFARQIIDYVSGPSELMLVDSCGHVPHKEKPTLVLKRLASFLLAIG